MIYGLLNLKNCHFEAKVVGGVYCPDLIVSDNPKSHTCLIKRKVKRRTITEYYNLRGYKKPFPVPHDAVSVEDY